MGSIDLNKVAMAFLGTVFLIMGMNFLSESIFHPHAPEKPGYLIEVAEEGAGDAKDANTGPAYEPITALLASANIENGQKVAKKCAACHTFDQGGANKVGPALYDIVNRAMGGVGGFGYSSALTAFGEGKVWDYESLNGFLWKPKKYMKGTAMGFAGIKKAQDRADLVAYLRSLSASPAPLP